MMEADGRLSAGADDSGALAAIIDAHRDEIIQLWMQRVRRDLAVTHFTPTDLQDGVGDYLRLLTEALRGRHTPDESGRSAWEDVARHHALTRVRQGFDLQQLV